MICGLARTHKADIDAAWGAVKDAQRPRIHTFISTSDIHIEHQLQTDREDVKGQARAAVALAKSYCEDVEFSPMDATRADIEFTAEVCAIAVEEGATVVNIPDTVGYTTPEEYADYLRRLYELVPGLRRGRALGPLPRRPGAGGRQLLRRRAGRGAPGRVRGQRDRRAGRQLLAGGDRDAGPASARTSTASRTGINTREIARTSRMVSRLTGYAIQPNKAIVGRNAFAHESGIHQDGVLKERSTYEIMDATEVGLESNSIVLGKHSGRHALKDALEQLGFKVEGNALNAAFKAFKEVADRKKQVTALDLEAIVSDEMRERSDAHELAWFEVEAGSRREPVAKVAVTLPSGEEVGRRVRAATARSTRSSARSRTATETECELAQYTVEAVTGGEDALGEVTVMLRADGRLATGQGVATDILEASRPRLRASAVQRPRRRRHPRGRGGHRRSRRRAHPRPVDGLEPSRAPLVEAKHASRLTDASYESRRMRATRARSRRLKDARRVREDRRIRAFADSAASGVVGRGAAADASTGGGPQSSCGLGEDAIRPTPGRLHRLHRRASTRWATACSRSEGGGWRRCSPAVPRAVLSHRSAAALWGIRPNSSGADRGDVAAQEPLAAEPIRRHFAVLPADEVTVERGDPGDHGAADDLRPRGRSRRPTWSRTLLRESEYLRALRPALAPRPARALPGRAASARCACALSA